MSLISCLIPFDESWLIPLIIKDFKIVSFKEEILRATHLIYYCCCLTKPLSVICCAACSAQLLYYLVLCIGAFSSSQLFSGTPLC